MKLETNAIIISYSGPGIRGISTVTMRFLLVPDEDLTLDMLKNYAVDYSNIDALLTAPQIKLTLETIIDE